MNDELKQQLMDASKSIVLEIINLPEDTVFSIKQLSQDLGYNLGDKELDVIQHVAENVLAKKLIYLSYGDHAGQDYDKPYQLPVQKGRNLAFSLEIPHYNSKLTRGKIISEKKYFIQKSDVAHLITQRKKFVQPNTDLHAVETIDVPVIYSIQESRDIFLLLKELAKNKAYHQKIDTLTPRDMLSHTIISSVKTRLLVDNGDPIFQELVYRTFGLADTMLEPEQEQGNIQVE